MTSISSPVKGGQTPRNPASLVKKEGGDQDERHALEKCQRLLEAESEIARSIKDMQTALDSKVLSRYRSLTEAEIRSLVVSNKWSAAIKAAVREEIQRLTQQLANRVKELEDRYAVPLPNLGAEVGKLTAKVDAH